MEDIKRQAYRGWVIEIWFDTESEVWFGEGISSFTEKTTASYGLGDRDVLVAKLKRDIDFFCDGPKPWPEDGWQQVVDRVLE